MTGNINNSNEIENQQIFPRSNLVESGLNESTFASFFMGALTLIWGVIRVIAVGFRFWPIFLLVLSCIFVIMGISNIIQNNSLSTSDFGIQMFNKGFKKPTWKIAWKDIQSITIGNNSNGDRELKLNPNEFGLTKYTIPYTTFDRYEQLLREIRSHQPDLFDKAYPSFMDEFGKKYQVGSQEQAFWNPIHKRVEVEADAILNKMNSEKEHQARQRLSGSLVTEYDFELVKKYCHHLAQVWWKSQPGDRAICDYCNAEVQRGAGSLFGSSLVCNGCSTSNYEQYGLRALQKNPDFYGRGVIQAAREYANLKVGPNKSK